MKWYVYLICIVLVFVGVFSGIGLYREIKSESYVNGSIDISNKFQQESFNYSSTSVAFYHDIYDETNKYIFEIDLPRVVGFNGEEKTYQVVLNENVVFNTQITLGAVRSNVEIQFYGIDGETMCVSSMDILIKFYSDKTNLQLVTNGIEQASFLEQYFSVNGIRLKVNEILQGGTNGN